MSLSPPASPAWIRRSADLGADYLLRSLGLLSDLFDGDMVRGAVFLAVLRASAPLPRAGPDRRPATLSAIARTLGLPVETTRRHVVRLAADGFATRTPGGGVTVTEANLDKPALRRAAVINDGHLAAIRRRPPRD